MKMVSANTDNAKRKLFSYAYGQVKRKSLNRKNKNKNSRAHPTPQAGKPSSLHELIIWSVSGYSPGQCEAR